jgi:hypothetical protein
VTRSAAAAGAMISATSSRLPSPGAAATVPTPSRTSSAVSQRATAAPSEGDASRSKAVSASGRWAAASAAPVASASPPAASRSAVEMPRQVAEQQLLEPRRRLGAQREQRADAEQRGDRDGDPDVGADPLVAGGQRDRPAATIAPPAAPSTSGAPASAAMTSPGQQPVAHRLGGVGLAVQQDPHAQRAEGEREDQDLEQRTAGDGVGEHQCSWCSTAIAVVPSARTTSSPPYVACSTSGLRHSGAPNAIWRPVQAQDALPGAGLADVVGRHEQRPPLPSQLLEQRLDPRGARRVDA